MDFDVSSIAEQIGALIGAARETLGMNPIMAGVSVAALCLLVVPFLVRRGRVAAHHGAAPVAARGRAGKARPPNPIDDRLAALRVDIEDPEAIPRIRRHFSGQGRTESGQGRTQAQYQLRRR